MHRLFVALILITLTVAPVLAQDTPTPTPTSTFTPSATLTATATPTSTFTPGSTYTPTHTSAPEFIARLNIDFPTSINVTSPFTTARGDVRAAFNLPRQRLHGASRGALIAQTPVNGVRADVRAAFNLDASYTNSGYQTSITRPNSGALTFTVCAQSSSVGGTAVGYVTSVTRTVTLNYPKHIMG